MRNKNILLISAIANSLCIITSFILDNNTIFILGNTILVCGAFIHLNHLENEK